MKKQITTITLGILMLASVIAMYSGESISFETNFTSPVYTVMGNSSSLEGLNVSFESGNITISTDPLMASDNFTMLFFDEVTNEIIKEVNVGSGSSRSRRTVYIDKNVTVYIPQYINTTEEIEIEKILDNTTVLETGYKLWHVLLAMAIGVAFGCVMMWNKKENTSEDIMEETGDATETD